MLCVDTIIIIIQFIHLDLTVYSKKPILNVQFLNLKSHQNHFQNGWNKSNTRHKIKYKRAQIQIQTIAIENVICRGFLRFQLWYHICSNEWQPSANKIESNHLTQISQKPINWRAGPTYKIVSMCVYK